MAKDVFRSRWVCDRCGYNNSGTTNVCVNCRMNKKDSKEGPLKKGGLLFGGFK